MATEATQAPEEAKDPGGSVVAEQVIAVEASRVSWTHGLPEKENIMADGMHARGKGPDVVFMDGYMLVNGVKVSMPPRPKNEIVSVLYDIFSLVGVLASVALVVTQLVYARRAD